MAQLNWQFVRSVFQDRTAMMETLLKETKVDLAHSENELRAQEQEISSLKKEVSYFYKVTQFPTTKNDFGII